MQKQQKRRKKEKKKERERRRRRNGDASSRSDCISLWLRNFNNGGKYPKKKKKKKSYLVEPLRTCGWILGFIYHCVCVCTPTLGKIFSV